MRASRSSRRGAPRHRFSRGATTQQGRPRRRGKPPQEEAFGVEAARHGESSGTGDGGLVFRNLRTGDGEGWEMGGETRSAVRRPPRVSDAQGARLTPAWMTSALPRTGLAFAPSSPRTMGNTVEDRDDDERAYPPPRSMKRFRGARTGGWLRPSCGAGTRLSESS